MALPDTTGLQFKQTYTIGETARLNNVSARALYHYQEKGMLTPSEIGPNRYRKYAHAQFYQLDLIKRFKKCGVPLKSLAGLIESHNVSFARELLQGELEKIQAEIDRLSSIKRDVALFKSFYDAMPSCDGGDGSMDIRVGRHRLNHMLAVPIADGLPRDQADFALRTVIHSPLFREVKFFLPFAFHLDPDAFLKGELRTTHRSCYLIDSLRFAHGSYLYTEDCDCLTMTLGRELQPERLDRLRGFLKSQQLTPRHILCEEYYDQVTNFEQPLLSVKVLL